MMPAEDFQSIAQINRCSTYHLRQTLRLHAVHKDGSPDNASTSNLLFPPSMIQEQLDFEPVKKIINCACAVCNPVIVIEPRNDARLISEIRDEPGSRVLLAILIHMGAGFAMRLLHYHGLGRGNDFNIQAVLERNPNNLKSKLFQNLSGLFGSQPALSVDGLAKYFCLIFAENKQLFTPPFFREEDVFREIPLNSNLPFIEENELRSRESSAARLYSFQIHNEFCSPALSELSLIRKELTVVENCEERNVLEFIRQKEHPNLIFLHLAYRHGNNLNLVFTFFPMDLRHILRDRKLPDQPSRVQSSQKLKGSILDKWLWENMKGVFEALQYVHDPNPEILGAHFDLKPANILVDKFGKLVITDFGLARIKQKLKYHSSLTNPGGDFNYRPPSSSLATRLDRKYDIWSLACIMIEVIIYLRDGENAVNKLAEDLAKDDNIEMPSQTFWKHSQRRYTLKKPVNTFLKELQDSRDLYLKHVGSLLQKMLSIDPDARPTVTVVCDALFAQYPISNGRIQVCGENTQRPLKNMEVSVQMNDRGLNNACCLDYWWNKEINEVSLHMNYRHGGETFNDTSTRSRNNEELIPMSIYERPDSIKEPMSFAFRYLYPDRTFYFFQSNDFYQFQAATTRQRVLSHVITSQCSLTLKRSGLHIHAHTALEFSGTGQIQIWRQIGNDEYRRDFVDDVVTIRTEPPTHTRHESMSHTRSFDVGSDSSDAYGSSSSNGTSIGEDEFEKDPRRLVIFLPKKKSSRYLTVPLSQGKAVLSEQEQKPNCITFERRYNQSHFDVGLFGDFGTHSFHKSGSPCQDTSLPGIPLDPLDLENREEVRATSLEVGFPTPGERENFLNLYRQIFPPRRR